MKKLFASRRGEGTYIGAAVFILASSLFLAFTINLFSVIGVKRQLDACADQLTRQIQLAGEVNGDTEALFRSFCQDTRAAENVTYTVEADWHRDRRIQLGTPFSVEVTAKASLGGFGGLDLFPVVLTAKGAGVSEEYWK